MAHYLLKFGELMLKKGNRGWFEKRLKKNLLSRFKGSQFTLRNGRGYLTTDTDEEETNDRLSTLFGLTGFAKATVTSKGVSEVIEGAIEVAKEVIDLGDRFRVNVRRTDKGLPLNSYEYACAVGSAVQKKYPHLEVNLNNPSWSLNIELREKCYIYGSEMKGAGGLPIGTAGKGLLLLSGGIDSPVAGYLMGKRGMEIDAVYFHTPPFTGDEVLEKVQEIVRQLTLRLNDISFHTINFTKAQKAIKGGVPSESVTLHSRATMMRIAEKIAIEVGAGTLITGEALSQVASQTIESLGYTNSAIESLVMRPLIGLDKEEIISIAEEIGTFPISIRPFADCCTLFAPEHPLTRPSLQRMKDEYAELDIEEMIIEAVSKRETVLIKNKWY